MKAFGCSPRLILPRQPNRIGRASYRPNRYYVCLAYGIITRGLQARLAEDVTYAVALQLLAIAHVRDALAGLDEVQCCDYATIRGV